MKTALATRSLTRAGVILVVAALAFTLMSVFGGGDDGLDRATSASDARVASAPMTDDAPADEATISPDDEAPAPVPGGNANSNRLLQNVVNGITFGLLLALASVGLSLIYGTTGLSNFAHGEQVSFGAVLTYVLTTDNLVSLPLLPFEFSIGLPLWLSALIAIAVAAGTGWLQDRYLWGALRRKHIGNMQQMIVSIGLSLALVNLLQWWVGGRSLRLTKAIDSRIDLGLVEVGKQTLVSVAIAVICLVGVSYFLLRTRLGRATRAVSDNASLAAASGIKVDGIVSLVWIIATGLAAVGGILLALYTEGTSFDAGGRMLLLMFAAVTLGGLGQPFGALVGSLVIGVVSEVSTVWLPPDLKFATALGILIVVLLVRPQGILGRAERVG